jgi:hypothetical protein
MAQALADPLLEFERSLLNILHKFGDHHTMAIASDEISRFMMQDIREHEHMVMFLNKLSESNDHMKLAQKKEYIRVFGKSASIFEEALVPYVQRIVNTLIKKAKEESSELNGPIAETIG